MIIQPQLDKREMQDFQRALRAVPKDLKKELKKEWKKEATPTIRQMRRIGYSGKGAHSVGRTKGPATGHGGQKRKHLKSALGVRKVKFTTSRRDGVPSFGGYLVIGYHGSKREKSGAHHIGFFHEFGTGPGTNRMGTRRGMNLPAREPFSHSWDAVSGESDFTEATDRAVGVALEKGVK